MLALDGLKSRVAAGRDGLTAEMDSCDILVDFGGVFLTGVRSSE